MADEKVVADEDAGHGAEEDGPAGEDGDEGCGLRYEIPWTAGYGENGQQAAAPPDVDIPGAQRRHVHATRDTVQHDAKRQLASQKPETR